MCDAFAACRLSLPQLDVCCRSAQLMAASCDVEAMPTPEVPEHFICPISLQIMRDPVLASDEQTCELPVAVSSVARHPYGDSCDTI